MSTRSPVVVLCMVLVFAIGVPMALIAPPPPRAHALIVNDPLNLIENALDVVENALSYAVEYLSETLEYYNYIKLYILDPLTFIQSGKATQALTGGVLAFVSGGANGTGQSQFVQNLPGHLRGVGDSASESFIRQLRAQSGSPYAGAIAGSLSTNYLQQSSLAGFFSANRNTLPQYSKNPTAFLGGNWSQGGVQAWFALTTQSQNNPYTLYERSQAQMGMLVQTSVTSHLSQINWGQGYLSWCGAKTSNTNNNGAAAPTTPCTNKDGTPGEVQTPGTTISSYLNKALALKADKVNSMGDAATQITSIIGTIMQSVQQTQLVLGGPQGGLAGVATSVAQDRPSLLDEFNHPDGYLGVTSCTVNKTIAENSPTNGQALLDNASSTQASWSKIRAAAVTASSSVASLKSFCTAQLILGRNQLSGGQKDDYVASTTQIIADAQYALDHYIKSTIAEADAMAVMVRDARVFVQKVRSELLVCSKPPVDYTADINALQTTRPTQRDMGDALYNSKLIKSAGTTPEGSLRLDEQTGTKIDQMTLLTTNSVTLTQTCTVPKPKGGSGGFGGFF
jgi:hypothetical protein